MKIGVKSQEKKLKNQHKSVSIIQLNPAGPCDGVPLQTNASIVLEQWIWHGGLAIPTEG